MHTKFCWDNQKEIYDIEDLNVSGKVILKCILEKNCRECGFDGSDSG